jgi:glycine/D-amino acid oxidase-like deaminating enzyme
MKTPTTTQDLVIVGGGIMGLMTAYYASPLTRAITIVEKRTIGSDNKEAASFSYTRSIRTDYLEPFYARLALESQGLWLELQQQSGEQLMEPAGCLNVAKRSITPDLEQTYAEQSYQNIKALNFQPEKLDAAALKKRFPQFDADFATLDTRGGYLFLPAITALLLRRLKERGVTILENTDITAITENKNGVQLATNRGALAAKKLVIVAGKGTNPVVQLVQGNNLQFPITYTRPQRKYYFPTPDMINDFMPENFPVFAYTDVGIYGHPIFDKQKGAVKVAYFVPVGMPQDERQITCVEDFVQVCLPQLAKVRSEDITDADMCWYDIVADDDFILGRLPGYQNIIVGTGWRGTGYKFAPLMGKILSQMALQNDTIYDIKQCNPERFTK